MESTAAQEIIDDRMVKLLGKLPQICPKIKKLYKETQVSTGPGMDDKTCYVCNRTLAQQDKVVNILTDVTSAMNKVGDILVNIFKTTNVTWKSCHSLCSACFVMIDRFDNLQSELSRIEAEMISSLSTSQQVREQRFLYGEMTNCKLPVWLLTQHVDLLARNLPPVDSHNISIPSQLPCLDISVTREQLDGLNLAICGLDGQQLVQLDQLLQYSPIIYVMMHDICLT